MFVHKRVEIVLSSFVKNYLPVTDWSPSCSPYSGGHGRRKYRAIKGRRVSVTSRTVNSLITIVMIRPLPHTWYRVTVVVEADVFGFEIEAKLEKTSGTISPDQRPLL